MKVELSEEDMQTLAEQTASILNDKLLNGISSGQAFKAAEQRTRNACDLYMGAHVPRVAAMQYFENVLRTEMKEEFKKLVKDTVASIFASEKGLRTAISKQIIEYHQDEILRLERYDNE
jgi:hypothetical protein